jgi:isopenicillin N synthase-like dioxygenase
MHGRKQFLDQVVPCMGHEVLKYVDEMTRLEMNLTDIFSKGLGLSEDVLRMRLLGPEQVVLF